MTFPDNSEFKIIADCGKDMVGSREGMSRERGGDVSGETSERFDQAFDAVGAASSENRNDNTGTEPTNVIPKEPEKLEKEKEVPENASVNQEEVDQKRALDKIHKEEQDKAVMSLRRGLDAYNRQLRELEAHKTKAATCKMISEECLNNLKDAMDASATAHQVVYELNANFLTNSTLPDLKTIEKAVKDLDGNMKKAKDADKPVSYLLTL